jgi:hypothetical protein
LPQGPLQIVRNEGLLSEKLSIYDGSGEFRVTFRLPRSKSRLAGQVAEALKDPAPVPERGAAGALPAGG